MSAFVEKLLESITAASLWAEVLPIAGLVTVLVLFKLGYNILKKNVNNATSPTKKAMK